MRGTYKIIGIVVALVVVIGEFAIEGSDKRFAAFVDNMPSGVRRAYLEHLFLTRDENCWNCYLRITGALEALQNDLTKRRNSYNFDYVQLLPFIVDDRNFREPIPEMACNIILLSKSDRVYRAMINEYRVRDPRTLVGCASSGLVRIKWVWPDSYAEIKQKLRHDIVEAGAGATKDNWGNSILAD